MGARAAALAALLASVAYLALAVQFPLGTAARPGAGLFPVCVGIYLCVVAAALALSAFRRERLAPAPPRRPLANEARARVAVTMGALVAYCLLLPWAGFPAVTLAFVTPLLRRLGGGWLTAAVGGLLAAAISYYLFAVLLGVPLPLGLLG